MLTRILASSNTTDLSAQTGHFECVATSDNASYVVLEPCFSLSSRRIGIESLKYSLCLAFSFIRIVHRGKLLNCGGVCAWRNGAAGSSLERKVESPDPLA